MMSSILWDITSCSLLKVNRYFGGTYRLRLQDRKINQIRNQHEVGSKRNYALTDYTVLYLRIYIGLQKHLCENLISNIEDKRSSCGLQSRPVTFTLSFVNISHLVQDLHFGTERHRQDGNLISLFTFLGK
jgi:hypothetical protein